jgi:hypothetical protein
LVREEKKSVYFLLIPSPTQLKKTCRISTSIDEPKVCVCMPNFTTNDGICHIPLSRTHTLSSWKVPSEIGGAAPQRSGKQKRLDGGQSTTLKWNLLAWPLEVHGPLRVGLALAKHVINIMVSNMVGRVTSAPDDLETNGCLEIWEEFEGRKKKNIPCLGDDAKYGHPPQTVVLEMDTSQLCQQTRGGITDWLTGAAVLPEPDLSAEKMFSAHHFEFIETCVSAAYWKSNQESLRKQSQCNIKIIARDGGDHYEPGPVKSDRLSICFHLCPDRGKGPDYNQGVIEIEQICKTDQRRIRVTVGENLQYMKEAYAGKFARGGKRARSSCQGGQAS